MGSMLTVCWKYVNMWMELINNVNTIQTPDSIKMWNYFEFAQNRWKSMINDQKSWMHCEICIFLIHGEILYKSMVNHVFAFDNISLKIWDY